MGEIRSSSEFLPNTSTPFTNTVLELGQSHDSFDEIHESYLWSEIGIYSTCIRHEMSQLDNWEAPLILMSSSSAADHVFVDSCSSLNSLNRLRPLEILAFSGFETQSAGYLDVVVPSVQNLSRQRQWLKSSFGEEYLFDVEEHELFSDAFNYGIGLCTAKKTFDEVMDRLTLPPQFAEFLSELDLSSLDE